MEANELINNFLEYPVIHRKDITLYYKQIEPTLKQSAIDWRIHNFVEKGVLKRIGNGKYVAGQTKNYIPVIENELVTLCRKLHKKYPLLSFCIWNTRQFNEFMLHQPAHFYSIVETEKDSSEYVFHYIKEIYKEVYLNPTKAEIEKYVSLAQNAYVVKDLISESPIQKTDKIPTITIEKMLVDAFCDADLYNAQQGSELETIFKTAFEKYTINRTKLFRYANRRKRKTELSEFIHYLNIL
jgi:hypothetical protein